MMEHFKKALTYLHTRWQRTLYAIKFWLLRMIGSEKDIGGVRVIFIRNWRVVLLGESPTDAGIREVWEETGYKINSFGGRLGIYRGRMGEKDSVIVLYTEDFEGGLKWLPNLEVMERGLFDLNNLPENLSPANRRRLIAFKKGVRNQRGKW
jgi:8-oxo-dGTP pyrophosphatase MutT (NUDIX family)